MKNFYIVDIEPLDNRYTKQWRTWIPKVAQEYLGEGFNVVNIAGEEGEYKKPEPGAFFDFLGTCKYKASQTIRIAELFEQGKVRDGDIFYFTDAWNQTIHFLKYMAELKDIQIYTAGIWHAGAYDPTDILGVKIKNKPWVYGFEASSYYAFDINFFGSHYNKNLFLQTLGLQDEERVLGRCVSPGAYCLEWIRDLKNDHAKENIVVFPHRLNYDKAPYVFDEIAAEVQKTRPDIRFVKTQEQNFSKEEYYDFLKTCKVIFSANKHENLGIGTFEAMCSGCIPLLPDKLSYHEMYDPVFKYEVHDNLYDVGANREYLARRILYYIDYYENYRADLNNNIDRIHETYFSGRKMFEIMKRTFV